MLKFKGIITILYEKWQQRNPTMNNMKCATSLIQYNESRGDPQLQNTVIFLLFQQVLTHMWLLWYNVEVTLDPWNTAFRYADTQRPLNSSKTMDLLHSMKCIHISNIHSMASPLQLFCLQGTKTHMHSPIHAWTHTQHINKVKIITETRPGRPFAIMKTLCIHGHANGWCVVYTATCTAHFKPTEMYLKVSSQLCRLIFPG